MKTLAEALKLDFAKAVLLFALGAIVIWALSYRYGPGLFPLTTLPWWGGLSGVLAFFSFTRSRPLPKGNQLFFHRGPPDFPRKWAQFVQLWKTLPFLSVAVGLGVWYSILNSEGLWGGLGSMVLILIWLISGWLLPILKKESVSKPATTTQANKNRPGWAHWTLRTFFPDIPIYTGLIYIGLFFLFTDRQLMDKGPQALGYSIFTTIAYFLIFSPLGKTHGLKTWLFLRIHHVAYTAIFIPLTLVLGVLFLPCAWFLGFFAPGWDMVALGLWGLVYFPMVQWGLNWWITRKAPLMGGLAALGAAALFAWALYTREILPLIALGAAQALIWIQGRNVYLNREVDDHVES